MHRFLLLALLSALLLLPSTAGASTSGIVVSQVYGGGGNSGATFQNDFVELFNAGATAVDISADLTATTPDPRHAASAAHVCAGTLPPGPTGAVHVDLDIASVLSISLDRSSLSFGTTAAGATPAPLPENVTVSSNNATGYS